MRLIGELDDFRQGEIFASYLVTIGIPAKCDDSGDGSYQIWVQEEDQLQQAKGELALFVADPHAEKYDSVIATANKINRKHQEKVKRIQKKIVVGTNRLQRKPKATMWLIGICVFVAIFTNFGRQIDEALFQGLAFLSLPLPLATQALANANANLDDLNLRLASVSRGELWRLFTPMLIHHGAFHLIFNMLWLYQLGKMIELRYGWWKYLLLVIAAATISNLVQCIVPIRIGGTTPVMVEGTLMILLGGMSGVVYGLFGFVWVKSIVDPASRFFLPQSTIIILLVWLVFCMLPGPGDKMLTQELFRINVANWAHAIGLLVGIVAAFLPFEGDKKLRA